MPIDKDKLREELAKCRADVEAGRQYKPRVFNASPPMADPPQVTTKSGGVRRRALLHPQKRPLFDAQFLQPAHVTTEKSDEDDSRAESWDRNNSVVNSRQDVSVPDGCMLIDEVDPNFRSIFPYPYFNLAQSECFETAYHSDFNMVVSAPTSTGKTVIMELAIVRLLLNRRRNKGGNTKAVYMAPLKALCQQIAADWRKKFEALNVKCIELTGDSEDMDYVHLANCDIILTTPEKWDSITRKWKENKTIIGQIALLLIDEVHLLNEDRGATLEAVVSRMNTVRTFESMADCPSASLRFIALSATIPNLHDIGDWLEVPPSGRKFFGQEYRPVKVEIKVLGFPKCKNDFLFENSLNYKLFELIRAHGAGKPALIFCNTRKSTIAAAQEIVKSSEINGKYNSPLVKDEPQRKRLLNESQNTTDKALAECIRAGVGFHTAGMQHTDRSLVERLFLAGDLLAICATTSLAQGVNFPAHLVIVKSTQFYKGGTGYAEHNEMTVLQMIGRAGRPQFDTSGVAVIMTRAEHKQKWDNILYGKQPIESHLLDHLKEHLNSEIVLKTITDISVAVTWLKGTYLFKRLARNPVHYGISSNLTGVQLDAKLKEILLLALTDLSQCNLIEIEDGFTLRPLDAGICMARYYVEFATMKLFTEIEPKASIEALIGVLSKAQELLSAVILRQGEKKKLYELSRNEAIRFPLDGKIKTSEMKVNCLIQATLGNITFEDWGLRQDAQHIFNSANRLMRGMVHFLAERKCFSALHNSIILGKCLAQKMWETSPLMLKQLDKIGPVLAATLVSRGITSFEILSQTDPRRIEQFLGRHMPFGNEVKQSMAALPKFALDVEQSGKTEFGAELTLHVKCLNEPKVTPYNFWHLIVGDAASSVLYYKKLRTVSTKIWEETIRVPAPQETTDHKLMALLVNEEYFGFDVQCSITPTYNPPPPTTYDASVPVDDSWLDKAYTEYECSVQALPDFGDAVPGNVITMDKPQAAPQQLSQQPTCRHTCKDKSKCKHDCCKGIRHRGHKRKQDDEDDIIDLTGRTDSNHGKRPRYTPLTQYFKPVVPSDQVVPIMDATEDFELDPSWFDEPFELPPTPLNTPSSLDFPSESHGSRTFTYVSPEDVIKETRLKAPEPFGPVIQQPLPQTRPSPFFTPNPAKTPNTTNRVSAPVSSRALNTPNSNRASATPKRNSIPNTLNRSSNNPNTNNHNPTTTSSNSHKSSAPSTNLSSQFTTLRENLNKLSFVNKCDNDTLNYATPASNNPKTSSHDNTTVNINHYYMDSDSGLSTYHVTVLTPSSNQNSKPSSSIQRPNYNPQNTNTRISAAPNPNPTPTPTPLPPKPTNPTNSTYKQNPNSFSARFGKLESEYPKPSAPQRSRAHNTHITNLKNTISNKNYANFNNTSSNLNTNIRRGSQQDNISKYSTSPYSPQVKSSLPSPYTATSPSKYQSREYTSEYGYTEPFDALKILEEFF